MTNVFPITFEVPAHPEPIEFVRQLALGLRVFGGGAGNHYKVPSDLEEHGIYAIRVIFPKGPTPVFDAALEMLVGVNMWCMRAKSRGFLGSGRGGYGSVYEEICYKPKVKGNEELWDSTEALYRRGHGVCEDLACARVAERRMVGDACRPFLIPQEQPGGVLFHVVVKNPNGSIEDPSGTLGMLPGQTNARCRLFLAKTNTKKTCQDCGEK